MRRTKTILGVVTAGLLAALPLVAGACGEPVSASPTLGETGVANPTLAGTWQFNRELSDCPDVSQDRDRDRLQEGMGGLQPGGQHRHGEGDGGLPGPGPGPGGACAAEEPVQLVIAVGDDAVTFTHEDRTRTLPTDGSAITNSGPGGEVSISGTWMDGALVETHVTPRGTMTATYTVSDDGSQLTVVRHLAPADEEREPRDMTHVWDRVTE